MDAAYLRDLQRDIQADPDCKGLIVLDSHKWIELPRDEMDDEGKTTRVFDGVMNPDYVNGKEALRRDKKIAHLMSSKRGEEVTAAAVSRALRGPWGDESTEG